MTGVTTQFQSRDAALDGTIPADEVELLRARLAEAEDAIRAIGAGEVDAIVVNTGREPVVYTLRTAAEPYRALVEAMSEGALTVNATGTIVYCNAVFACLVGQPREQIVGAQLSAFLPLLGGSAVLGAEGLGGHDIKLRGAGGIIDAYVSAASLVIGGERLHCLIVTDLTRQQLRQRHEAIVQSSSDAIVSLDANFIVETWNSGAERLFRYSAAEAIGRDWLTLVVQSDRIEESERAKARIRAGERVQMETVCITKDGRRVEVSIAWAQLRSVDGAVFGMSAIASDITDRKRVERALRESEERFARAQRAARVGTWDWDIATDTLVWTAQARHMFRLPDDGPVTFDRWRACLHPDDRDRAAANVAAALAAGPYRDEFRVRFPDGDEAWLESAGEALFDDAGRAVRMLGTIHDITQRKRAEAHTELIAKEIDHRAKNLLAVVRAVALQSAAKTEPREFAKRFGERISALATSHDLLVRSEWRGVEVGELARGHLAHFADLVGTRVVLDGPVLQVTPAAAQAIGMALHELATNAGKYGALSGPAGVVRIIWELAGEGPQKQFAMQWSERDGPPCSPPKREGFGRTVIVTMAEHALDASVSLTYPASGLVWRLSTSPARVLSSGGAVGF